MRKKGVQMDRFIYVFKREDRDALLSRGFELLSDGEDNETYVFANSDEIQFSDLDMSVITSNTLYFSPGK